MALTVGSRPHALGLKARLLLLATPALIIFISSNVVNFGNLAFNMIFSRLMGPELFGDLALLSTIKLGLLGLMGGVQMAVSQLTAAASISDRQRIEKAIHDLNRVLFVVFWLALPIVLFALWRGEVGIRFGLENPNLLLVLFISTPFAGPLHLLRGYAFGLMHTGKIVLSANVEMGVRLFGSLIFWQLGFGIEGCVAAIILSIILGWLVLVPVLPKHSDSARPKNDFVWTLGITALPFVMLQFAQIVSLDGEIFLAKSVLSAEQAGFVAALSLFQRIQFFACFSLAFVLLPSVTISGQSKASLFQNIAPVFALSLAVAIPFLAFVSWRPDFFINLLVGREFSAATAGLWLACLSASAFTLSFMIATLMAGLNDQRGIWITVGAAALQIALMSIAVKAPDASFLTLLHIKAATQCTLCLGLCAFATNRIRRHSNCRTP